MKKNQKQYKITICGAASKKLEKNICKIAEDLGREIAKRKHILITGAATGVSSHAAYGAKKEGGLVIGISPTENDNEKNKFGVDFKNHDIVVHTGFGYKGRNVISIRTGDGVIVVNGRFGTLSEIANAEGEGKPIVIIKNTKGCASIAEGIFKKLNPSYKYFSTANSPEEALDILEKMIKNK